jgi:protein-S-isoprenylcysteine O-methyltransferase Ste14
VRVLELKVPPVALTLASSVLMAALARLSPFLRVTLPARTFVALAIGLAGLVVGAMGVASFRRARTTVNPLAPDTASSLVRSGIYAHTRNPMYVGLAMVLAGWAAYLSNLAALAVVPLFVLYLDRFQIVPEERALRARFGAEFTQYATRVRRWL